MNILTETDPFILAFVMGLLVLLFFSKSRLDTPFKTIQPAKIGDGADDTIDTGDPLFVHRLPPSAVRVARFFWVACAVYFFGLTILLALLCMLVAAGLDTLAIEQGGLVPEKSATGEIGIAKPPATPYPFVDYLLKFLNRESTISDYPWQPLVLALGLVGLLPSLPFISAVEERIRRISLRVAGIPSKVIKLWHALKDTPVPNLNTTEAQHIQKRLATARKHFLHYTGYREGSAQDEEFVTRLAQTLYYRYWMRLRRWPEARIRRLIDAQSPGDLDVNLQYALDELSDLKSLSSVVAAATARNDAVADGFSDGPQAVLAGQPAEVTQGDLEAAHDIIGSRWRALHRRLSGNKDTPNELGLADYCCLMIAIYSERSNSLGRDGADTDEFSALRSWVRTARRKMRYSSVPVNYALFCATVALTVVGVAHYFAVDAGYITISDFSTSFRASLNFEIGVLMMILCGLISVHWIRDVLDDEGKWMAWTSFFRPPFVQYLLFAVGALCLGAILQFMLIFIEPRIEGLPGQFGINEMFEGDKWSTALLAAFPGVVLAIFFSLAHDQRERPRGMRMWLLILLLLGIFFMYIALSFNEDYAILVERTRWSESPQELLRARTQAGLVIAAGLFVQVMISINLLRGRKQK